MDRAALLAAMDSIATEKPKPVEIKAWGQTVYVRALTADDFESNAADADDPQSKHKSARAVARVLCDENGKRLFDPDNKDDVDRLAAQPWALHRKILAACDFKDDEPKKSPSAKSS